MFLIVEELRILNGTQFFIHFVLHKGCVPNVQRAALVNLGDLTAYDQAKTFLVLQGFDPDNKVLKRY